MISHLKNELDKYHQNDNKSTKEIFIAEPDRTNLELYNELNYSRELISKLSRMLNQEKTKILKLEAKINVILFINLKEFQENFKNKKISSKNFDKISILDNLSSSDEIDDNDSLEDNFLNLESPVVKFPEKIKMKKGVYNISSSTTNQNNKSLSIALPIPKLDLTNVKAKYHNLKNIEIAEVNNVKNSSNRSSNEYIEKLKFQLKVCKNTMKIMKKKHEKYKKDFQVHKQTIIDLKNKNEILELQLKKSPVSTNDDTRKYKKDVTNTSMVYFFLN
jgi:hypothetical protein